MKTLVTAVSIAVLAFLLLEIAQSDARRGEKKCPDGKRPAMNNTEVKCDSRPGIRALACLKTCTECYERELLQRPPSCLVNGTCTCLARPAASNPSTTVPTTVTPEG